MNGDKAAPGAAGEAGDWTQGPAKWAAVVVLGAASIIGMAWSMTGRVGRAQIEQTAERRTGAPDTPWTSEDGSGAAPSSGSGRGADAVPAPGATRTININTASAAELELLPGIGPALAERIIKDRQEHGPFKRLLDLDRVKGIGPRTIEKIRPMARVE